MRKITSAFLLGMLTLLTLACSKEEDVIETLTLSTDSEVYFTSGMSFDSEKGSKSISFSSTKPWKATLSNGGSGWCTASPVSGQAGNATVVVNVAENVTNKARNVTLTLVSGSIEKVFTISQNQQGNVADGLTYSPEAPDADSPLTITFKASSSSELNGYTGDVYAHIGVVSEGTWMYVPADWGVNTAKCKMTSAGNNVWSITLSPSIRQWFASGETAINKLGIVIRSSDGSKKGIESDSFVTVTDTKFAGFVPAAIKTGTLPAGMEHGININNNSVTLVMYDKDKNGNHKDYAHVVGDFNNWKLSNEENSQMFRDDAAGCWWITIDGLDASKEYAFQYYVGTKGGDSFRLADAYCEKILDPDNDKYIPSSTYPDNKEYPAGAIGIASVFKIQKDSWQTSNFKRADNGELIIYELLLRDFTASGDIAGMKAKLPYLKSLGVNAIEFMPVQEFDGNDSWGYNPCFFFALDKAYGTKNMYKELINACHENGMAVIFDVVYNHATGNHPFAKLYWNSATNKTATNNPWFNVDAPHPYSVFHDFNHESDLVQTFVKRNLKFLLEEYNIDGFRFDLTKGFTQKSSTESSASNKDDSRIAILKGYNDAIKAVKPEAIVILEHFCAESEESELSKAGMMLWRNLNTAYCQSAMGYQKDPSSAFTALTTWNTTMTANGWVGFMESHDEERMAYKQTAYSQAPLKADLTARMKQLATNAALCFTVSGPKMIWQFGELGYDISINENGRTGKKPIHWDYYEIEQRKGLYDTYAKLLALRTANPTLFSQDAFKSWSVAESDWTNGRDIMLETVDGKKLVVVGNFTNAAITRTAFPSVDTWKNYMTGESVNVSSTATTVEVPAHEFRLYVNF